jgi:hypothetical protein
MKTTRHHIGDVGSPHAPLDKASGVPVQKNLESLLNITCLRPSLLGRGVHLRDTPVRH